MRRSNHSCRILPVLLAGLMLASLAAGCLLNAGSDKELQPGTRDYTWSVDTLDNGPGYISDLWGASPDDIWAVASGGFHHLWHYDGQRWSSTPDTAQVVNSAECIFGLSADDIWAGGNDGEIFHYNGERWTEYYSYKPDSVYDVVITSIDGNTASNLFAAGVVFPNSESEPFAKGLLLHFDGNNWKKVLVTDFGVQFQRIRVKNNFFIQGVKLHRESSEKTKTLYLLKYTSSSNNLLIVKKGLLKNLKRLKLNNIGNSISLIYKDSLYIKDNFIYKLNNNEIYDAFGRSRKDVFMTDDKKLFHYNGTNIEKLLDLDSGVWRTLIFKNKIIFNIHHDGENYIYRGIKNKNKN